ncbi:hypothetical protein AK812_SmicGene18681 [Symbiodinium microadriaticum]|uniref:Uncharacterized protein n=1 Tax=Symbiodinium microadriaticum TaxID=2951 RepID=A0A1Q9DUI7_SYMMI|nr:hypothetical protein AK812_SmicGene18681 [Symbiodinium microadriaticum]
MRSASRTPRDEWSPTNHGCTSWQDQGRWSYWSWSDWPAAGSHSQHSAWQQEQGGSWDAASVECQVPEHQYSSSFGGKMPPNAHS